MQAREGDVQRAQMSNLRRMPGNFLYSVCTKLSFYFGLIWRYLACYFTYLAMSLLQPPFATTMDIRVFINALCKDYHFVSQNRKGRPEALPDFSEEALANFSELILYLDREITHFSKP